MHELFNSETQASGKTNQSNFPYHVLAGTTAILIITFRVFDEFGRGKKCLSTSI